MAHEHDHDHEHPEVRFVATEATDDAIALVRETHPKLAELLDVTRRWAALEAPAREEAAKLQASIEKADAWMPGFHAEGDKCATCGKPTTALFTDSFEEGSLPYAAFLHGLPVHATRACLDGFAAKRRDVSPRGIDKARRELTRDLERPTPRMSQFFRHDVLAHPPFGLEDWANSVAEANKAGLDRAAMRDLERVARFVHARLFHHH